MQSHELFCVGSVSVQSDREPETLEVPGTKRSQLERRNNVQYRNISAGAKLPWGIIVTPRKGSTAGERRAAEEWQRWFTVHGDYFDGSRTDRIALTEQLSDQQHKYRAII